MANRSYETPPAHLVLRRSFELPWTRRKRQRDWEQWKSQHWDPEANEKAAGAAGDVSRASGSGIGELPVPAMSPSAPSAPRNEFEGGGQSERLGSSLIPAERVTASDMDLAMEVARRRVMQDRLGLSPRETEVLRLLHDGLSVPAIAMEMFISMSTAKTYVTRLYEKLGAANRSQALMAAIHHGLIQYERDAPPQAAPTRRDERAERTGLSTDADGPSGVTNQVLPQLRRVQ